jgi:hypothetical protein
MMQFATKQTLKLLKSFNRLSARFEQFESWTEFAEFIRKYAKKVPGDKAAIKDFDLI